MVRCLHSVITHFLFHQCLSNKANGVQLSPSKYSRYSCYQFTLNTSFTSHKTQLNKQGVWVIVQTLLSVSQSLLGIGPDQLLSLCCLLSLPVSGTRMRLWTMLAVHVENNRSTVSRQPVSITSSRFGSAAQKPSIYLCTRFLRLSIKSLFCL